MPLHTVAASARSLRFLEHSTRLLRTFSARSLRTHIELRAHGCRAVDASAHGCSKCTVATIPRTQYTVATNIQRTVTTNTHRVKGTRMPGSGCLRTRLWQAHGRYDSSNTQLMVATNIQRTVATKSQSYSTWLLS